MLEKYVTKSIIYGRYKTLLFTSGSLILVPCSTALLSKECFLSFRASNIRNDTCNIDGFYVIRLAVENRQELTLEAAWFVLGIK